MILEDGITIGGKTLRETLEASGHARVFRKEQVFISGSKYPVCLPEEIEAEIEDLCERMCKDRGELHPTFVLTTLVHWKQVIRMKMYLLSLLPKQNMRQRKIFCVC